MPALVKPLFRPEALRPKLAAFQMPAAALASRPKLVHWANFLATPAAAKMKETELLGEFLGNVFGETLGFTGPAGGSEEYTIKRESLVEVDGKFADAALGRFSTADGSARVRVALEGKGPTDPLDRPFKNRKKSAVEQAAMYAINFPCDWYVVTNLNEIRLYHKGHDQFTYERFETKEIAADDDALRRLTFLLGAPRVVLADGSCHLDGLLSDSQRIGRELTNEFYREYRQLREKTFRAIRDANPQHAPGELLAATQKILDRVLFIAFCEDRELLPREIIARAYQHSDPFNPRPIWQNFVGLFRSVDKGNKALDIWRYNGGLFAADPFLEGLAVPDDVCEGFKKLADYEYGNRVGGDAKLIDVEILGHIFEQSITDLEELHRALSTAPAAEPATGEPSKRKKEGAFYTPGFVTRYIVAETLGPVLRERFEKLRAEHEEAAARTVRKALADPTVFDAGELTKPQTKALVDFWEAWLTALEGIRILDPSCGSGAFLIEAFDQLFAEYKRAMGFRDELAGKTIFDIQKTILTHNLFGCDLNAEAVEIARLSCWIKTAEYGKELTTLDGNIRQGNSVVDSSADRSPVEMWRERFPGAFQAGGFDVVIGNPPYVRHEWIKEDKPYLERYFKTFDAIADLYVYFYELGFTLLKRSGRLGFISSNSFLRAGYAENMRAFLASEVRLRQLINLGDTQIFDDAKDVYPVITIAENGVPPSDAVFLTRNFRRNDQLDQVGDAVRVGSIEVPVARLDRSGWQLDNPEVFAVRNKLFNSGIPLGTLLEGRIYSGIKTGLTKAFVVSKESRKKLIQDGRSHEVLKPLVTGQEVRRWHLDESENWLILFPNGSTAPRCGSHDEGVARQWLKKTYPAVEAHLTEHEPAAAKRGDKGEFWWELRPCDYIELFDAPKIMYPDIAKFPRFALDTSGHFSNDTAFFLPVGDYFLLGILNSDAIWFALSGISVPFGERAGEYRYRLKIQYVEKLPIPVATPAVREAIETAAKTLVGLTVSRQTGFRSVLDWLRLDFGIEKPTQRLQAVTALDADGFIGEVSKIRGKKNPLTAAAMKRLRDEHAASVVPLQALEREADGLERKVSDLVNDAFGLTPDDVRLMWETAPPRMPIGPPSR